MWPFRRRDAAAVTELRAEIAELQARMDALKADGEKLDELVVKMGILLPKARQTITDLTRAKNEADRAVGQARAAAQATRSKGTSGW